MVERTTTQPPTLEDLQELFTKEITKVAEEATETLRTAGTVSQDLRDRIQEQVRVGVEKEAASLSEAVFPFLERFAESRLSSLSQSILQSTIQAIVVPEAPPPRVTTLVETVNNTTSSVTSSLEVTYQQGTTTSTTSVILWKWNRTDLSQFDTASIIKTGPHIGFTMSYQAVGGLESDAAIVCSVTYSYPGGGIAFRVATSEGLVLPERFLVRCRYGLGNNTVACVGPWVHNNNWSEGGIFGIGVGFGSQNRAYALRAEGSASGGPPYEIPWHTPFVLPNNVNSAPSAPVINWTTFPTAGLFVEYDVRCRNNSFPDPPVAIIDWRILGHSSTTMQANGLRPDRGLLYRGFTSSLHQATPVTGWNGVELNSFGMCFRSPPDTTGQTTIYINDIVIMKHWMDW